MYCIFTIMATNTTNQGSKKKTDQSPRKLTPYSPEWVVNHVGEASDNKLELVKRIRKGVPKQQWKRLLQSIGAAEKDFELIIPTSISSLQKKSIYGIETSDWVYQLALLYGTGYAVFESREQFTAWLHTPSKPLGDKKPFDLLDSSFGFEMVEREIMRIRYNVYS